jgi:hypothetical protein
MLLLFCGRSQHKNFCQKASTGGGGGGNLPAVYNMKHNYRISYNITLILVLKDKYILFNLKQKSKILTLN